MICVTFDRVFFCFFKQWVKFDCRLFLRVISLFFFIVFSLCDCRRRFLNRMALKAAVLVGGPQKGMLSAAAVLLGLYVLFLVLPVLLVAICLRKFYLSLWRKEEEKAEIVQELDFAHCHFSSQNRYFQLLAYH